MISGALHVAQPKAAVWINFKEAQGSKVVTPIRARELAADLSDWFLDRLDAIAELEVFVALHDDICYGWSEAKGVFALSAVYGVEPKPLRQQDKRECPVCGKVDVFAKPPDLLDPEWSVLCANCHWVAEPSLYGHYAAMFEDEAS